MTEYKAGSTRKMVKISMMSVVAFVLMLAEFQVPIFPEFLKVDLSDVPALIAGFAMGPMAGVMVVAIKNILHLLMTKTGGIGELANFIVGGSMVFAASFIYYTRKNKITALIGLAVGIVVMAAVGAAANFFILLPFYSTLYPIESVIEMSKKANVAIKDIQSLVLYGVVPFNIFKGLISSAVVMLIYKRISVILHKE